MKPSRRRPPSSGTSKRCAPRCNGSGTPKRNGSSKTSLRGSASFEPWTARCSISTAENTNLKAQRLSFGAASQAADAFRGALEGLTASRAEAASRVDAAEANAIASVREIEVLQAPHIAEADDAAMTAMEKRMAASAAAARRALGSLAPLVAPAGAPRLAQATAALDRFMMLNAEIVSLSRRNTNIRSVALSLGQRRMLTAAVRGEPAGAAGHPGQAEPRRHALDAWSCYSREGTTTSS